MKATFVIPTKDCAHFLPIAVQSVMTQTHKDVELVIVDDGSKDSTGQYLDWLDKQENPRIITIRNRVSLGRCKARNQGNDAASGDYIFVLDADDAATPNRVELTLKKFAQTKPDFVYGSFSGIDAVGNLLYKIPADVFNRDKAVEEMQNRICHSTVAYTKEFAQSFPYSTDPEISRLGIDDWEQQIRSAFFGAKFDFTPQLIGVYREHDGGISKTRNPDEVKALKTKILDGLKVAA